MSAYSIHGYWWLLCYLLLVAIILMDIGGYYIGGYWCLLLVIILMAISANSIDGY